MQDKSNLTVVLEFAWGKVQREGGAEHRRRAEGVTGTGGGPRGTRRVQFNTVQYNGDLATWQRIFGDQSKRSPRRSMCIRSLCASGRVPKFGRLVLGALGLLRLNVLWCSEFRLGELGPRHRPLCNAGAGELGRSVACQYSGAVSPV